MLISLIAGTRPEVIKLAPVYLKLRENPSLRVQMCATAQHRRMLDTALEAFGIVPDADLDLMEQDQTLAGLTARALLGLDGYIRENKPDVILVQGDTTTVLCGALAAFYHKVKVGHVEAGLRTRNKYSPFPEEMNRTLASRLADWHFAPTEGAKAQLLKEGIEPGTVHVTGNTVIDALYLIRDKARGIPFGEIPELAALNSKFEIRNSKLILVTGHRRESFGQGFRNICRGIRRIAGRFPDVQIVYPVHLNPNVQAPVREILGSLANVHLIEPLSYLPFVKLMDAARVLLTDSGGIQEEGPALGKPVLVMREVTERPEAVEAGVVRLVGADEDRIFDETERLLTDEAAYRAMARGVSPYGDGKAAGRIAEILVKCGTNQETGE
jgi:UDP-N-acetylglucosamine 2-epimerase (non-hydrolysing)